MHLPIFRPLFKGCDPTQFNDPGQMDNMVIATPDGQLLPSAAVANGVHDLGLNAITGETDERVQLGLANVSGRDLCAVAR